MNLYLGFTPGGSEIYRVLIEKKSRTGRQHPPVNPKRRPTPSVRIHRECLVRAHQTDCKVFPASTMSLSSSVLIAPGQSHWLGSGRKNQKTATTAENS